MFMPKNQIVPEELTTCYVCFVTLYPINALKTHLLTSLLNIVWSNNNLYTLMMVFITQNVKNTFKKYKHLFNQIEITVS